MEWNSVPHGNVSYNTHLLQGGWGGGEIRNLKQITMHAGGYLSSHGAKIDSRAHPFSYKRVPSVNMNYNKILFYYFKVTSLFLEKNSTEIPLELERSQCKMATHSTTSTASKNMPSNSLTSPTCILLFWYMLHNCDLYTFLCYFFLFAL
jgi:hypothetical protein